MQRVFLYFSHIASCRTENFFILSRTMSNNMADTQTGNMSFYRQACMVAYLAIVNNKYYFTFISKGHPEEEEFGNLGFIQPYYSEVNPARLLGRPLNHNQEPANLLPIPTLLSADCLNRNSYPWNILCFGIDGLGWDRKRHSLFQDFNAAAYQVERSSITEYPDPSPTQSAMSTVTGNALQTSYP